MDRETTFIQVGVLEQGFAPAAYILDPWEGLAGHVFIVYLSADEQIHCVIESGQKIRWNGHASVPCRISHIRPYIALVDFIAPGEMRQSITLACHLENQTLRAVFGTLPTLQDAAISALERVNRKLPLSAVEVVIRSGTFNRPWQPQGLIAATRELIGLRNEYRYSPDERYEHIYLNDHQYAWHCLNGVEKGLADVDYCHTLKLSERLYLFIWQEKIIPTLGIILIDLALMRTDGKIMGYQNDNFTGVSNFAVGAKAHIINQTSYLPARRGPG